MKLFEQAEKIEAATIVRQRWIAYLIALAVSGLAFYLKITFMPWATRAFALFFVAVTISAFFGGFGPGLFSSIVLSLVYLYRFLPPDDSFAIPSSEVGYQFSSFLIGCLCINGLTASLYKARRLAVKSAQQQANFVANVSHEVRTPLNAIIGLSGVLRNTKLDSDQRKYVETIRESSEILLRLVNDILEFSKLDANKFILEESNIELLEELQQTLNVVRIAAEQKGLRLCLYIDGPVPSYIKADSGRLRQILLNLLGNAVKFTDQGEIKLKVSLVNNSGSEKTTLRFEIMDQGIGIAPEKHAAIFQPFVQGDASTTRKYAGTGLGLSISKSLVELMGGRIGVESSVGKGSNFWFEIQVESPAVRHYRPNILQESSGPRALKSGRPRILVAEDQPVNQLVAVKILEQLGCFADSVSNGVEVMQTLEQLDYDLILMDCHMPEMDGYESTKVLRQSRKLANRTIPIIAMTAYNSKENVKRCIESGMNECLAKPLRVDDVRIVLKKWLNVGATLDLDYLNRVDAQLGGDSGFQREILEVYLSSISPRTEEIDSALASGSQDALKCAAHALRSASQTIGASRIAAICERLEMGSFQWSEVDVLRSELDAEVEMIKRMRLTVKPNREKTT